MRTLIAFLFAFLSTSPLVLAQSDGHRITVSVPDFEGEEAYLAYHFGSKQYIRDTATVRNGTFTFASDTSQLEGGIYMVVFPPNNQFFEILISEDEQHFSVENKVGNFVENARFEGSPTNSLFYEYLGFLGDQRTQTAPYQKVLKDSTATEAEKAEARQALAQTGKAVKAYQKDLVEAHPESLAAKVIQLSWQIELPDSLKELPKEERQQAQLEYYREHFFDYTDLSDGRIVRTPLYEQKLNEYLDRLTARHPDSLSEAVDHIMGEIEAAGNNDELYKFTASHFLNKFARSKYMGMDAVYAHVALNYYDKGKAFWMEEEEIQKIVKNARKLVPLLIGNKAPDLQLKTLDGKPVSLHKVKADYTIVYFWDPDCGICKKASKVLVEVYDKYKDKGIEIFGVCNKTYEELAKCGKSAEEKNMTWINAADPYGQGQAHSKYDIRANPTLFILDKDKTIIYKQIGAKQVDEILARELKLESEEK